MTAPLALRLGSAGASPDIWINRFGHLLTRATLLLVGVGMILAVRNTSVDAATCTPNTVCYGTAYLNVSGTPGSGFLGVAANIRANCLSVPSPSTRFINDELWLVMDELADGNPDDFFWTEVGVTIGPFLNYKQSGYANYPVYFWADFRPNYTYNEWINGSGPALNSYFFAAAYYSSGSNVVTYTPGLQGNSTSQQYPANWVQGGVETISDGTRNVGSVSGMQYATLQGSWRTGWTSGAGNAKLNSEAGTYATWADPYNWLQMGTNPC